MSKPVKPIRSYTEVIKSLRDVIKADYAEGGWLPGGRKMAKQLNVGYSSYCKAVAFLENEGLVTVVPKRGHYAFPSFLQLEKVGIIVNSGDDNPFLQDKQFLAHTLLSLDEAGLETQILQGNSLEAISDNAISYGVKGIICIHPSLQLNIKQLEMNTGLPVITVCYLHHDQPLPDYTIVTYDSKYSNRKRFKSMIEKGHKSILYIGEYKHLHDSGITTFLKENGIILSEDHCLLNIWKKPDKLLKLLKKTKATGIVSEGGFLEVNSLFETLSQLPRDKAPDVYVTHSAHLNDLYKKYPKIKLTGNLESPKNNLGKLAAEMMIEHLKNGTEIHNIFQKTDV